MEEEKKRCFLYRLGEDGLHVYEGTYERICYNDGYCSESFKLDNGKEVDWYEGYDYDRGRSCDLYMEVRDDEGAKASLKEDRVREIESIQTELSWLEKGIILGDGSAE